MLEQKERGLLARIAFALCREGMLPEAETVFSALAVSAPDKDGPAAGLALCGIIKGRTDDGIAILDDRLAKGSAIKAQLLLYKLLALGMGGRPDEAAALRKTMADEGMTSAIATADAMLADMAEQKS